MATNLTASTRELWDRTVVPEVYQKLILPRLLMERKQVAFKAGTAYKFSVDKAEMDDLAQEYTDNDQLVSTRKTLFETVQFGRKRVTIPVEMPEGEILDNEEGGDGQIFDLRERIVAKGHRAMKLYFRNKVYEAGSATCDADKGFHGIADALTHGLTYGGLGRATTVTNKWWQGASIAGTFADYADAIVANITNFRSAIDAVSMFTDNAADIVAITSNPIYRALQAQVQASFNVTKPGKHAQYGFQSMEIDGVEVFAEPWLTSTENAAAATTAKYFYLLNLNTWKLALSPSRKFGKITPFFDQAQIEGGRPKLLARVYLAGDLFCTQPNANLFRSNMG